MWMMRKSLSEASVLPRQGQGWCVAEYQNKKNHCTFKSYAQLRKLRIYIKVTNSDCIFCDLNMYARLDVTSLFVYFCLVFCLFFSPDSACLEELRQPSMRTRLHLMETEMLAPHPHQACFHSLGFVAIDRSGEVQPRVADAVLHACPVSGHFPPQTTVSSYRHERPSCKN